VNDVNIYEFDLWDGDKGIIIAPDYETAEKELKKEYGDDIESKYESVYLGLICSTTDKGLFVTECGML
jgi:hypothetical protein